MQRFFHNLLATILAVVATSTFALAQTDIPVQTDKALLAAIRSAQPGDTILLAPGTYGDATLDFGGAVFSPPLRLTSTSPQNPAEFRTLAVSNVTGFSISGVHIDLTATTATSANVIGLGLNDTSDVTINNVRITGANAVAGVSTDVDPKTTNSKTRYIGHPLGNAIYVRDGNNLRITGNKISGFQRGITLLNGADVLVAENEIFGLRGTPFRSIDVDRIIVRDNHFHSFRPVNFGGQGDHGDHMHFRQSKGRTKPIQDILIESNLLQQGRGQPILGIVFGSKPGWPGYERVVIQNNIIRNSDRAGIVLEGVRGGIVRRNTLVPFERDAKKRTPIIRVWFDCADLTVVENITPEILVRRTHNDVRTIKVQQNFVLKDRIEGYPQNIVGLFVAKDWGEKLLKRADFAVSNKAVGALFGAVN